jgi:ppGpp synthetase/RelA/SpoT-type nucleotidyltranferase
VSKEQDFVSRWHQEREFYLAWGEYLSKTVIEELSHVIAPLPTGYFLKTQVQPRLKADRNLIEKAFYRNKNYNAPYDDITDKVGTRFVVLLGREISTVVDVLEAIPGWTCSRDRDYEEEQKKNPIAFDYAAVHFVVRPKTDLEIDNVHVPASTPCEVQIKTILQHAYSELTHDTIYKPQIQATPEMQRNAAKAMALLEATNDYFEKVSDQVNEALNSVREITSNLTDVYKAATGLQPRPSQLEGLLLEAYEPGLALDYVNQTRSMLAERPFLAERIKERVSRLNPLFSQPAILLAYLDVVRRGPRALEQWPLTPSEMEPLLNDLGESRY